MRSCSRPRQGFTLIELLVVIAIIGILVALLVPAVQMVRARAANAQCLNNIKQLALACHSFESTHRRLPMMGDVLAGQGVASGHCSWIVAVLPYIEQKNLYDKIYNGQNSYAAEIIQLLLCPMDPRNPKNPNYDFGMTDYVGITGWSYNSSGAQAGVFRSGKLRPDTITDGSSNTIMIGERPYSNDYWWGWWAYNAYADTVSGAANSFELYTSDPKEGACDIAPYFFGEGPNKYGNLCSVNQLWSGHSRTANFAFADASVRGISYHRSTPVVVELSTIAGGEVIAGWD